MIKKVLLCLIVGILIPLFSISQTNSVDLNVNFPDYLKCGDSYYTSDFKGLKSLMNDLRVSDNEVYAGLLRDFQELERNRNIAIFAGGSAVITGTIITGIGLSEMVKSSTPDLTIDGEHSFPKRTGGGVAIAGGVTVVSGLAVIAVFLPGESEYYNFINLHNRLNKKNKVEWKVGISPFTSNGLGLSVKMNL